MTATATRNGEAMNYATEAERLREIADALEDMKRAQNHLEALVEIWDECSDEERLVDVRTALSRLDGTWRRGEAR